MAEDIKSSTEDKLITQSTLKDERGWTKAMIDRFLPEPDETKRNPMYRSAAPMKLYALARVEEIEATDEFEAAMEKAEKRRRAARKAAEKRRRKTITEVEKIEIEVPRLSRLQLTRYACEAYNDLSSARGRYGSYATHRDDEAFLRRIEVNYLRHEATPYEYHLDQVKGKVGTRDAYHVIRGKVLDAIAEAYPYLADECERQRGTWEDEG